MEESKSLINSLIESIDEYLHGRGVESTHAPKPVNTSPVKKAFSKVATLTNKVTSHKLKTGQFLRDILEIWKKDSILTSTEKEELAFHLFEAFIDQTLKLDEQEKMGNIESSKLLKACTDVLLKKFPSKAELKKIRNKLEHLQSQLLANSLPDYTISYKTSIFKKIPLVGGLMMVPMIKEHQIGSHPEKIDAALDIAKKFLIAKTADDYVNLMLAIAEGIKVSRSSGGMARSRDLEDALVPFADYIVRNIIRSENSQIRFTDEQILKILDKFNADNIDILPMLHLAGEGEYSQDFILGLFSYLFDKSRKQPLNIAKYIYENAELLIEALARIKKQNSGFIAKANAYLHIINFYVLTHTADANISQKKLSKVGNMAVDESVFHEVSLKIDIERQNQRIDEILKTQSKTTRNTVRLASVVTQKPPQMQNNKNRKACLDGIIKRLKPLIQNPNKLDHVTQDGLLIVSKGPEDYDRSEFFKRILDKKPGQIISLGRYGYDFIDYSIIGKQQIGEITVTVEGLNNTNKNGRFLTVSDGKTTHSCLLTNIEMHYNQPLNLDYAGLSAFLAAFEGTTEKSHTAVHCQHGIGASGQARVLFHGLKKIQSDISFCGAIDTFIKEGISEQVQGDLASKFKDLADERRRLRPAMISDEQFHACISQLILLRAVQLGHREEDIKTLQQELGIDPQKTTKLNFGIDRGTNVAETLKLPSSQTTSFGLEISNPFSLEQKPAATSPKKLSLQHNMHQDS